MNTKSKQNSLTRLSEIEEILIKNETVKKERSLRPMRSMMSVKSLRPRTLTVSASLKSEVVDQRNA